MVKLIEDPWSDGPVVLRLCGLEVLWSIQVLWSTDLVDLSSCGLEVQWSGGHVV